MTTLNVNSDAIMQTGLGAVDARDAQDPHARGTRSTSLEITDKDKEAHLTSTATAYTHDDSRGIGSVTASDDDDEDSWPDKPTEEEMRTLRRVSGRIKWGMWTIAFCELCERFSYYGSSILYTNLVVHKLPPGSTTGAPLDPANSNVSPGVLGLGPRAGQGISLFNQFFAYIMPLVGAWIADARMGRYWTIHLAIGISIIAHVILVASTAPSVIPHTDGSFAAFIIGMLCLCVGTGFFKANVSPLLAEQTDDVRMYVKTLEGGERVIVDPAVTNTRIFLYFYLCINIGALAGQIGMVYVERYVGFWAAFAIPTFTFLLAPVVLGWNKKHYRLSPPTGSVLSKFFRLFLFARKHSKGWHLNWDSVKPSNVPADQRPHWMTYDDAWVDEVRRGLMACKVFLFLPVFMLAYNQMTGNLTTQASTMELHGTPNDVIQNLDPIAIVLLVPLFDHVFYPGLRKLGINFSPIKRMTVGFFVATCSMVAAAVMQYYIYKLNPLCGKYVNGTTMIDGEETQCPPAPINVWAQSLPYILVALAELLLNVTSYEYAFSKAPENMKSMVMSVNLFMSAVASAIGEAWTPLSGDPLLVWNYTSIACIAFVGGILFWICFHHLDHKEDELNNLKHSKYMGETQPTLEDQKIAHEA